jgi:hypothetical protein
MINKNEQHILDLPDKAGRVDLKQAVEDKFPDNLQKLIRAKHLRDFLYMLINSVINWTNDNVDLRAYANETLVVQSDGQVIFQLEKKPVNPSKDAVLTIDGVKQQYGDDFTITDDVLTFIPGPDWALKTSHKVVLKYRYYLANMGNGGGGNGNGGGNIGVTEIEVTNQTSITINHNLGRLPIVVVYEGSAGVYEQVIPLGITATSLNCTVSFGTAFTGKILII